MSIAKINNQTITTLNKINSNNFYPLDSYTKLLLKFNGVDGAQAYTAETGQTVTFAGTAQLDTAQSKFGGSSLLLDGIKHLYFDGNDYVLIGGKDWKTNIVSYEAWFCATSATRQNIIGGDLSTERMDGYNVRLDADNKITVRLKTSNGSYSFSSTFSVVLGEFYHVAITYDGTIIKLYINGFYNNELVATGNIDYGALTYLYIGRRSRSDLPDYFSGLIKDVRIWSTVRTQQEIQDNMYSTLTGSETGLVGYWKMDEGTGTTLTDSAGSNNGTITGATWTGSYLTVPDSDDWNFGTGDFTIDFWVRFNSTGTIQTFIGQRTDPTAVWFFLVRGDDGSLDIVSVISEVTTINIASNQLSWETGTWYHLAVVRNGNNFYIFRDGIIVHSDTSSGNMPNSSNPLAIGIYGDLASSSLDGHMENVRVSKGIARWTSNFTPPVDIAKINGITI